MVELHAVNQKTHCIATQNDLPGDCIEIIVIVVTPYENLKTHYIATQNDLPGHCIEIIVIVVTPYVNLKTHYIATQNDLPVVLSRYWNF